MNLHIPESGLWFSIYLFYGCR